MRRIALLGVGLLSSFGVLIGAAPAAHADDIHVAHVNLDITIPEEGPQLGEIAKVCLSFRGNLITCAEV
jgi:hypothetical protein